MSAETMQGADEAVARGRMTVEAAILSKEIVTVYTRTGAYESTGLCIKDWITLAKSRHADRFEQPANGRTVSHRQ